MLIMLNSSGNHAVVSPDQAVVHTSRILLQHGLDALDADAQVLDFIIKDQTGQLRGIRFGVTAPGSCTTPMAIVSVMRSWMIRQAARSFLRTASEKCLRISFHWGSTISVLTP